MTTDDVIIKLMYGVWIPDQGWVRGNSNEVFADVYKQTADQLAARLGRGATVYYIDRALIDLEEQLLEAERRRRFVRRFFTWLMRSIRSRYGVSS